MAKAKPPGNSSESDAARVSRALELFVLDSRGFSLAVVTYHHPRDRDEILRTLEERLLNQGVEVLTARSQVETPEEMNLFSRLESRLDKRRAAGPMAAKTVMMVIHPNISPGALGDLNIQRELFPDRIPYPVIFWVDPGTHHTLATRAPDFWHWRSASFELGSPTHRQEQLFDLAETPIGRGTTVIEASAGTGKTYCLTGLVLRLLLEGKVSSLGRLLVVTFTKAATEELVGRIRSSLVTAARVLAGDAEPADDFQAALLAKHGGDAGAETLRRALLELDDLMVATIHGFCKRALDQCAFESGMPFEQELLEDDTVLLRNAARDFWRRRLYGADPLVTSVVTARHWTPDTFLPVLIEARRHPNTEILPKALPLPEVSRRLAKARQTLAESLGGEGKVTLRRRLSGLAWRKGKQPSGVQVELLLNALERFGVDSLSDEDATEHGNAMVDTVTHGLRACERLEVSRVQKDVMQKDHYSVERQPVLGACEDVMRSVRDLEHSLRVSFVRDVAQSFEQEKRRRGWLTFDDLLGRLRDALADPRHGRTLVRTLGDQYQAALIDEFQDTDLVQYEIFSKLFPRSPLFLIGDPKQAIYRFRGADVFAYMMARRNARSTFTLQKNWRSTQALVDSINTLFRASERPFVFEEIPFVPVTAAGRADEEPLAGDSLAPLQWLWLPAIHNKQQAGQKIRRGVALEISRLLGGGMTVDGRPLRPGDIAVLVRTNDQAQAMQRALRRLGIPAVLGQAGDVYQSDEMGELERLLRGIVDPGRSDRVRAACATRLWGDDAHRLLELERDDLAWQRQVDRFAEARREWLQSGFMPMMQRLIDERHMRRRLLGLSDGERRLTNLLHAVELLHQASHERHLSPAGLLGWLVTERQRPARDSEATELRLESDSKAVQVSTVHKSKGLEYEVVFCPFLWEARKTRAAPVIAHPMSQRSERSLERLDEPQVEPKRSLPTHPEEDRVVYDFGSERFKETAALAEAERLAEDLRLAYVALTRARKRCYVVWGPLGRKKDVSASGLAYLLHPAVCSHDRTERVRETTAQRVARVAEEMENAWDRWEFQCKQFVDRQPSMGWRRLEGPRALGALSGASTPASALQCRSFPDSARDRLRPWRIASFTSLSHTASDSRPVDGRDRDGGSPLVPRQTDTAPPAGLFAFAQGAGAGSCLHEILEECDFQDPDGTANRELIDRTLERHGLVEATSHRRRRGLPPADDFDPSDAVVEMLRRIAGARLPGTDFTLADVAPDAHLVEWQFFTPLGGLAPARLASLFHDHGHGIQRHYGPHLASLDRRKVQGFLTGFVDWIFTHRGRWYVIDWKSNHLGNSVGDYGPEALRHSMEDHHYILQYHLYVLALHRYLKQRLGEAYTYDESFGGVYYLFLRGLSPDSDTGWWYDRPPLGLIDALDRMAQGHARDGQDDTGDGP